MSSHFLLADLLRARLRQASPADTIAALHTRAAAWYERNGFVAQAVGHGLAAPDFDGAARLVEQNPCPLMTRGESATLLRWIEALPADLTRRRPQFLPAKARALTFAGAAGQVEALLQQAEAQIEPEGDTPAALEILGDAAAIRAFLTLMSGDHVRGRPARPGPALRPAARHGAVCGTEPVRARAERLPACRRARHGASRVGIDARRLHRRPNERRLRHLRLKGLMARVAGTHRDILTTYGRKVAYPMTKLQPRIFDVASAPVETTADGSSRWARAFAQREAGPDTLVTEAHLEPVQT